ncbi:MAG: hypothetical protein B7733_13920 [Myxococcales bacterium FL481]|nr:MAG: hypothetical protein B7733_13920 [Myxococcales bacterium FL481]
MCTWTPFKVSIGVIALTACSPTRSPATAAEIEPAVATPADPPPPIPEVATPRPPNTIFRSELRRATDGGRPAYLLAQLGPEVHRPHGAFAGWRITQLFPSDPQLCRDRCDLVVGDVIVTVNGSPIERPEQLSALVDQIETMSQLSIRRLRGGEIVESTYAVVDDE